MVRARHLIALVSHHGTGCRRWKIFNLKGAFTTGSD